MKNVAASVRAKLLNLSRAKGVPLNTLMEQYATGRFLYRLAQSQYRERFILKGAQLFRIWEAEGHRPTRDLDLLGFGAATEEAVQRSFTEIIQMEVDPADGLEWGEVVVSTIRDDVSYGGVRAKVNAGLAGARLGIQIDVGFGDVLTPGAVEMEWHELISFPSTRLLVYPPETVAAEKLEAAVKLGRLNSRMKDFYDLHWLAQNRTFETAVLTRAIRATFERRQTPVPDACPLALTQVFAQDKDKQVQWQAFLRKNDLAAPPLAKVIQTLHDFLWPLLLGANRAGGKDG